MNTDRLRDRPDFVRFWAASTVSGFGSYVTTLALQVLVVVMLVGTATDVGVVNAARWLPYLALGLVAGVLADRLRRRPMLVITDLGRAALRPAGGHVDHGQGHYEGAGRVDATMSHEIGRASCRERV